MKKNFFLVFALVALVGITNCSNTRVQSNEAQRILGWKSHAALGCIKLLAIAAPMAYMCKEASEDPYYSIRRENSSSRLIVFSNITCIAMFAHSVYQSFKKSHKLYKRTH